MRRRRDRYLQRRTKLLNALTRLDLMPADDEARAAVVALDPYALRRDALARRLEPHELGRVMFHLNQRRGFKSNRKVDRSNDAERGKIAIGADKLAVEMARAGQVTLGAWLAGRHARQAPVRARMIGAGAKAEYPFYPTRELIRAEFDAIWAAQLAWNPMLTAEMRDEVGGILFHQRDLRPPKVGKCWLEPNELRAPKALPSTQAFRIRQDLAHLAIRRAGEPDLPLTSEQIEQLAALLEAGRDLSFGGMRRALKLSRGETFNIESAARKELKGAATAARLAGKGRKLAALWAKQDVAWRDAVAQAIQDAATPEEAMAALMALGIARDAAEEAEGATLPEGHASLSSKAMGKIMAAWRYGMTYDKAVLAAGYRHHSDDRDGVLLDRLPYYGAVLADRLGTGSGEAGDDEEVRFGRVPNPTVHVALNQVRHVVNAILARHGPPAQVVVELLRELNQSGFERRRIEGEQNANRKLREAWGKDLTALGQTVNGRNLDRMRLWVEQAKDPKERRCPYTGEHINLARLFSAEVEEDHIIPFAISLDNSFANRVLVMREANRRKTNRTPFQAFGAGADWAEITQRVALLPNSKQWRFGPDALEKWKGEHEGFLDRHLTDSAYLARLARLYLRAVCDPDQVYCVPGRLTALLRGALGLNSATLLGKGGSRKDRTDHRHHAIDALTVGLIDRSLLQRVATAAGRAQEVGRRLMDRLPEPWPGFIAETAARAQAIVVSHKAERGPQGRLFNDNPFGAPKIDHGGGRNLRRRRALTEIATWKPSTEPKKGQPLVEDSVLRARIDSVLRLPDAERVAALAGLRDAAGHLVRRVRAAEAGTAIAVTHGDGRGHRKLLVATGNHRMEFWRLHGGAGRFVVVTLLEAAREAVARRRGVPRPRPVSPDGREDARARLMIELHKGDMVATEVGEQRRILVVKSIWANIVEFLDATNAKPERSDILRMAPNTIMRSTLRKVRVDPAGRVFDPGPMTW
jgi:CRISPR-associated endonuclease Csn1